MFGNVETNDASISRSQAGESSVPPSGIARSNTHSIRIFASFTPGTEMTSLSIGVSFASSISLSFGGRLVAVSLIALHMIRQKYVRQILLFNCVSGSVLSFSGFSLYRY